MPKKITDPTIQKKVRTHLKDKNDTISEMDIKIARTHFENAGEDLSSDYNVETITANTDPAVQTTWSVLEG